MLEAWAASFLPLSASSVTVAIWPPFTLPISDSLSATRSCIDSRLLITANGVAPEEPEVDDEELPAEPVVPVEAPVAPVEDALLEELLTVAAFVVPVAETVSPT